MLECFEAYLAFLDRNGIDHASRVGDVNCGSGFGHSRFSPHDLEQPSHGCRRSEGYVNGLTESLGGVVSHANSMGDNDEIFFTLETEGLHRE